MNILVTGGAGYIGSHTVKELLLKDHNIVVFDNLSSGHRQAVLASAKLVIGDILDKKALDEIFSSRKFDAVMHFAASIEAGESVLEPGRFFYNNGAGSLNLLEAMKKHNVKNIIFSSSAAVYGEPEQMPITETHPKNPTNTYGLTKLQVEQMLERYDIAYGIKSVSLRYFNAAGADPEGQLGCDHKHKTHIITVALLAALGKIPKLEIYGTDYDTKDGTCVRDFIHVTDLARAHVLALEKLLGDKKSNTYNLGNEKGNSVREVVAAVKEITGKDFPVVEVGRRDGDPQKLIASSQKAKKELGWSPKHSTIEEIVKTAWQWQRQHPEGYNG